MTIHEVIDGGGGFGGCRVVYSVMNCDGCSMVYPLQEVAKGKGRRINKDRVIGMLKQ